MTDKEREKILFEFSELYKEAVSLYKGDVRHIGNWIYAQKRENDYEDLNRVLRDCIYRIKRGVSIKNDE